MSPFSHPGGGRYSADQLGWVQKNRQRRFVFSAIGGEVERQGRNVIDAKGSLNAAALARRIGAYVDDDCRRVCTLGEVRANELVILVEQADCVYHMRHEWHFPLLQYLKRAWKGTPIRKIEFRVGRAGLHFESTSNGADGGRL